MGLLRAAWTLASTLTLSAACSALYGSDFDKYSPRDGAGGHDASTSSTAGTGGLTSPGLTGGIAGTSDGGTAGSTGGASTGGRSAPSGGSPNGGATGGTISLDSGNTGGQSLPTGGTAGSGGVGGPTGGTQADAGTGGAGGRDADAGTGGRANPKPDARGSEAGPIDPPLGTLWSNSRFGTGVFVCFTSAPHIEWDGELHCNAQAGPGESCSGDPYTGSDLVTLGNAFLALIEDTWSRATNLEFFADECPTNGGVVDTAKLPNTLAVTFVTNGRDPEPLTQAVSGLGMHPFASDLHVDWKGLLAGDPETLRTIVREMGRVLGFPYEWVRGAEVGAPNSCPPGYVEDPHADFFTRPDGLVDYFSVMDRCTPTASTGPGLSPGDVIGAQLTYGTKQTGGLVGYRAYCADVEGANPSPGAEVVGFPCRRATNDSFCRCSQNSPQFKSTFGNQEHCLSVSQDAVSSGFTAVVSDPCDASRDGQKFTSSNVEWRAMGNMCLAAANGRIELEFCDGSAAQRWNFWDVDASTEPTWDQIQNAANGQCATAQTLLGAAGELILLAPCSAADPRQHFQFKGEGFIGYGSGSWCLNVLRGAPAPGSRLGMWDGCLNPKTYNSQFHVSGTFTAMGQCLTIRDRPGFNPGVGVEPCTAGARREIWDFHF